MGLIEPALPRVSGVVVREKAAEPLRAAYGRASRRGTAAAAAGGIDGPFENDVPAFGGDGGGRAQASDGADPGLR